MRTTPSTAYVKREFIKFLTEIGMKLGNPDDLEKFLDIMHKMQAVARKRGMSEYEMATTYDADSLLDIYRESIDG